MRGAEGITTKGLIEQLEMKYQSISRCPDWIEIKRRIGNMRATIELYQGRLKEKENEPIKKTIPEFSDISSIDLALSDEIDNGLLDEEVWLSIARSVSPSFEKSDSCAEFADNVLVEFKKRFRASSFY